ncbi:MAG: cell wall hydrolase [Clostridiales bacterium]|nr:cell wall hydrolase [Clostridiales bacterium]
MKTTKKLLVTLFTTVILPICFGQSALASELDGNEQQQIQEATIEGESQDLKDTDENAVLISGGIIYAVDGELPEFYVDEHGQIYIGSEKQEESGDLEENIEENLDIDTKEKVEEQKTEEEQKKKEEQKTEEAEENKDKNEKKKKDKKPSYSKKDLRLLAGLVYSEARNQSYEGMLAVANVVLNRAKSDIYWHVDTIEEVIYDKKWSVQFSVTVKNKSTGKSILDKALDRYDSFVAGNSNDACMERAIKAAKAALEGENNIGKFLCFNAYSSSSSSIKKKYDYKILGDHIFYRTK